MSGSSVQRQRWRAAVGGSGVQRELWREVGSLPLSPLVRVGPEATLGEVARRMREADVSAALVGELPRELVTERDLARALADGLGPDEAVERVASRVPVWVTTTSQVVDAAEMMVHHHLRHLIVISPGGEEVGVVSMRDLFVVLLPEPAPTGDV